MGWGERGVCLEVKTDLLEIILDAVFGVELHRLLDGFVCEFVHRHLFGLRV